MAPSTSCSATEVIVLRSRPFAIEPVVNAEESGTGERASAGEYEAETQRDVDQEEREPPEDHGARGIVRRVQRRLPLRIEARLATGTIVRVGRAERSEWVSVRSVGGIVGSFGFGLGRTLNLLSDSTNDLGGRRPHGIGWLPAPTTDPRVGRVRRWRPPKGPEAAHEDAACRCLARGISPWLAVLLGGRPPCWVWVDKRPARGHVARRASGGLLADLGHRSQPLRRLPHEC